MATASQGTPVPRRDHGATTKNGNNAHPRHGPDSVRADPRIRGAEAVHPTHEATVQARAGEAAAVRPGSLRRSRLARLDGTVVPAFLGDVMSKLKQMVTEL